jgi:glucosamine kinase
MPDHSFVLAVDGGGSSARAELFDAKGNCLGRGQAGPANLSRDPAAAMAALADAWRQSCRDARLKPADAAPRTILSAALAGVSAASGRARFYADTRSFARAYLSSDAYAALLGAFEGGPGVLLSIGTGTIACRLDAGRFERLGGWGFPAGDRGGGAWIGLQAVAAWLDRRDGLVADSPANQSLWQTLEQHAGTNRSEILVWLRAAGPADYAALAPAVLDAAEDGSPVCGAILAQATAYLAALLRAVLRPALEVALSGGLAPLLAPRLAALLERDLPCRGAPLRGAWLVASSRMPPQFSADEEHE